MHKAYVRDTNDPDRVGRIRCYCPELMGEQDSSDQWTAWCSPETPVAKDPGVESGSLNVPPVGALVWISLQAGSSDFPIYHGGIVSGEGADTSDLPKLALGEDDGSLGEAQTVGDVTIPASSGGSSRYPFNRVVRTPAGHTIELDDTGGNRRIRIKHADGSFVELRNGGDLLFYVLGGLLTYAASSVKIASRMDIILSAAGKVKLGGDNLTENPLVAGGDGVVTGRGIDPFTGTTYGLLGNASTVVLAKKT